MMYVPPRPVMQLADLQLLSRLRASGARLEQVVEMRVAGVKASIGPMPEADIHRERARQRIRWSYGSESNSTTRIDIAIQIILAKAIIAKMPEPLQLDDLELRRMTDVVTDVHRTVSLLRELLLRRTGEEWSVRVGKGKHKQSITITSMPKTHVDGEMRMLDAALLAALTDRALVNPASGITIGASPRERISLISLISGNDLVADRRAAR
jgi:hypothetical protein